MFYAYFRGEHTLVSYPYYTKYTKASNKTFFRHVDCNLAKALAKGTGVHIIQRLVSLTKKNSRNCTEVLTRFHN